MTPSTKYIGTSERGITREIEIKVPWGIIAGKVLGNASGDPVLCLHGWLDNCNTFDPLLPFLPKEKYYVLVDIPGHGISSKFPIGMTYTLFDYISIVERIRQHYNWQHFSIIGHSLGGNIGGCYSGTFPEHVDKLIILDAPGVHSEQSCNARDILRKSVQNYLKLEENPEETAPHSYTQAQNRWTSMGGVTSQTADVLLQRGLTQVGEDRFAHKADVRHKIKTMPTYIYDAEVEAFLDQLTAETLHIVFKDGLKESGILNPWQRSRFDYYISCFDRNSEHHERVDLEGHHHEHMRDPLTTSVHISRFLRRPPRHALTSSPPHRDTIKPKL